MDSASHSDHLNVTEGDGDQRNEEINENHYYSAEEPTSRVPVNFVVAGVLINARDGHPGGHDDARTEYPQADDYPEDLTLRQIHLVADWIDDFGVSFYRESGQVPNRD